MKPTTYSCQMVRASNAEGDRDRRDGDRAAEVADDQDRAPAEAVDPDAGRQAEQDERQELDRRQQAELERR